MRNDKFIIENQKIIYEPDPKVKKHETLYFKPFVLDISKIKIIAISPRLYLGDEMLFVLFVEANLSIHVAPLLPSMNELLNSFELNKFVDEWEKFSYADHYTVYDKIVYPKSLYWEDLYEKNFKLKIRRLLGIFETKLFWGDFRQEVIDSIRNDSGSKVQL